MTITRVLTFFFVYFLFLLSFFSRDFSEQKDFLRDHFELTAESAYNRPWTLLTSSLSHTTPLDLAVNMIGMVVREMGTREREREKGEKQENALIVTCLSHFFCLLLLLFI